MSDSVVLVTGATGRQGGAVARELLAAGRRVRALTRNPASAAATRLGEAGVEVVAGDLEDRAALERAVEGVQAVFSIQNYWEKGVGAEGEIRQGRNLADAAKGAGVEHFVQASVAGAETAPGVQHFECKLEIERYIDAIGLPRTFIGTVFYMDNFLDPKIGRLTFPVLAGSLRPETRMHMVAVRDIGTLVARVFAAGERYLGEKVDVAGDVLTVAGMKDAYRRASGREPKSFRMPSWLMRLMNAEFARQLAWNNERGWTFGLDEVREHLPDPTSFEDFLREHQPTNL